MDKLREFILNKGFKINDNRLGFKFFFDYKEHYILWNDNKGCIIDVIDNDWNGSKEVSISSLEISLKIKPNS